jgi:CheY-like chemotaxis protein
VFVMNKPSPSAAEPTDVDVRVELVNDRDAPAEMELTIRLVDLDSQAPVAVDTCRATLEPGAQTITRPLSAPGADVWDLDNPKLYRCEVSLAGAGVAHRRDATFGFRWFAPDLTGRDAMLRLNGRRIVARSAISWGFFPISGMVATPEMAARQIEIARRLGLNMLNAHRTIAQPTLLDEADRRGLLYYCEPGGYKAQGAGEIGRAMAAAKLMRMIRRDRNHPSVVIYGMMNELFHDDDTVQPQWLEDIVAAHEIDPTRTIILASGVGTWHADEPGGSWMAPYDMQRRQQGWFDEHHAGSPGVWADEHYNGPEDFRLDDAWGDRIVFWGEEGALASPSQLDSLLADFDAAGAAGWDGDDYRRLAQQYRRWLDAHDGGRSFASLNDWARSLGAIAYEYQGRMIENVRLTQRADGYVINGWESQKMENTSGVVDIGRHAKGPVEILAWHNQPAYVALKPYESVLPVGGRTRLDVWALNEIDLSGPMELTVAARGPDGAELLTHTAAIALAGGDRFSELLAEGLDLPAGDRPGYVEIEAEIARDGQTLLRGRQRLFVVDPTAVDVAGAGAAEDVDSPAATWLRENGGATLEPLEQAEAPDWILIDGAEAMDRADMAQLLDRIRTDGGRLIVLTHAHQWAQMLSSARVVEYDGQLQMGKNWNGGSFFALTSPLLQGLPQATGFNWPYQVLGLYKPGDDWDRYGLRLGPEVHTAVGAWQARDPHLASALAAVELGAGEVVLSTLPIPPALRREGPAKAVAQRLLANLIAQPIE